MLAECGQIDILVNNAGITKDGLATRMKKDAWDLVLQINLTGAFSGNAAGAAVDDEIALGTHREHRLGRGPDGQRRPGELRRRPRPGIIGLTKCHRARGGIRNITVNAVAPGFIETDMTKVLPETWWSRCWRRFR